MNARPAAALLLAALAAPALPAQDDDAPLRRGRQLMLEGSYARAAEAFLTAGGLDRRDGLVGASRAYMMAGERRRAAAVLREEIGDGEPADFPQLAVQLAEVLRAVGRSREALALLAAAAGTDDPPTRALAQYGALLRLVGEKAAARAALERVVRRHEDGLVYRSGDVAMAALAHWLLGDAHAANSLFDEAVRSDPANLEAHVLRAELFFEKRNAADAALGYREALEINPRHVPALVGLGRVGGDEEPLRRALAIDPDSPEALHAYGEALAAAGRWTEAAELFERALAVNPESVRTLAALAARAALSERMDEYRRLKDRVDAFSPDNAEFLGAVAEAFGGAHRFAEAAEYARAAVAADPEYWPGHTLLGVNLLRLGEVEEGKASLETGYENDPFDVTSWNMLEILDTLETYELLETEHFRVRMSERDAGVLWPYLEPLLEEAWAVLTAKYGFEPEDKVLIEVFENAEDFAARSLGLPDIGPLVGICFGKVVTLISPAALTANWQEIVWHELAHVITLQMTGNRIPRWLSEGVSVWEEKEGRPWWGRDQGLDLVRAAARDRLAPLAGLDAAFTGARDSAELGFAYFQSYLVVDYIAAEHGFDRLAALIRQYGAVKEDGERFREALGLGLEEFEADFRRWIARRVEEIGVHAHVEDAPDAGDGHGHGIRENPSAILAEIYNFTALKRHMRARIEENARDFQAHLQLGIVLFKEEAFDEARLHLRAAHEMLPTYTGHPSPALVLAQIHERQGDEAGRRRWLEALLENFQHDYDSAMVLARAALDESDFGRAARYIDRAMEVDPYRGGVHELGARYAEGVGDTAMAVTEREVLARLEVGDPVEARTRLAEAYLSDGRPAEAERAALAALEAAPSYRRAQRALLAADRAANR